MSQDIFIPTSKPEDARVDQLHTVTYVTSEKDSIERAFRDGYGLEWSGWQTPAADELAQLNTYFGFPEGAVWEMCLFHKSGEGQNIQVRVIHRAEETDQVRPEYDGLLTGGATLSFPKEDLYAHEKVMKAAGFDSTIGVKEMEFESPTGEVYVSAEIIYFGPENTYLLAVKRPDIFVPVGPMDKETGIGGAAYSARCVANADEVSAFLGDVMGYEIRRDVVFPIGEKSALLLPEGAEERFIQAFAPGSSTAYLVIMDHKENNHISPAPTQGPPSRGLVMWSFRSKNIDDIHKRAVAANIDVLQAPADAASPFLGSRRTLVLIDPDGFPIEIFED